MIAIGARAKAAGEAMVGEEIELSVRRQDPEEMEPYERLIGDAMLGDATLFAGEDSVEAAWARVDPILGDTTPVLAYEAGTWVRPRQIASSSVTGGGTVRSRGRSVASMSDRARTVAMCPLPVASCLRRPSNRRNVTSARLS